MNPRILLAGYIALVLLLHLIPTGSAGAPNNFELGQIRGDYLIHMAIFLPWMGLVRLYLSRQTGSPSGRVFSRLSRSPIAWLLAGILLAVSAEGIKYWLPYCKTVAKPR